MKINIQKVIKCVTCLVTCFMLVIAGMATPAKAVEYLKPSNYLVEVTAEGNTKTAHYSFSDRDWLITAWNSTTGVYEDYNNDVYYFPDVSYKQAIFQAYPFGGPVYGDSLPWNSVAFDVSDILPGSPIDFEFPFYVRATWDTFEQVHVSVECTYGVSYYDKSGKLLNTIYGISDTFGFNMGSSTHNEWEKQLSVKGSIPAIASYIVPFVKVDTVLSEFVPDMQIYFGGGSFDLYIDVNTVIENSNMMQSINNKLDSIISGTPEQNENANNSAGVVEDQKNQIGDLVDQMTPSRPNTDHIDTDINAIAGDEATSLFADGMSNILSHPIILAMLSIVAVVSFVGYVLFGKVG